jgi:hypothetical protein
MGRLAERQPWQRRVQRRISMSKRALSIFGLFVAVGIGGLGCIIEPGQPARFYAPAVTVAPAQTAPAPTTVVEPMPGVPPQDYVERYNPPTWRPGPQAGPDFGPGPGPGVYPNPGWRRLNDRPEVGPRGPGFPYAPPLVPQPARRERAPRAAPSGPESRPGAQPGNQQRSGPQSGGQQSGGPQSGGQQSGGPQSGGQQQRNQPSSGSGPGSQSGPGANSGPSGGPGSR